MDRAMRDPRAQEAAVAEAEIHRLAGMIAQMKSPHSALSIAASPHEVARALYLLGWQPPVVEESYEP